MSSVTPTTSSPQFKSEGVRKTENLSPTASKTSVISESFNTTKSQVITASGEHSFAAEKVVFKDCNIYMGESLAQPDLGSVETMDPISSASEVKVALRALYNSEKFKTIKRLVDPTKSLSISESFIRLAVVLEKDFEGAQKEALDGKKGDSTKNSDFVYLNSHEAIMQPKKLIEVGELFEYSALDKLTPSRLLAVGAAGVGKSTLCQYLANTWAEHPEKLGDWKSKFDYLFLIRLRDLASYSSIPTLAEAVKKSLRGLSLESIEGILSTSGNKILYLLDGYDEVASWLSQNEERNAFFRELLRQPNWLLTTRPNYFNESMRAYNCRKLEIIGFTSSDIKKYIDQFFKDSSCPERAPLVHQLLNSNSRIAALSHIPINLELLCSVWKMKRTISAQPYTMTKLYGEISGFLFRRYIKRRLGDNSQGITLNFVSRNEQYRPFLQAIETIAWKGLTSHTASLIIDREIYEPVIGEILNARETVASLKTNFYSALFNDLGFFRSVPSFENSENPDLADYYFIHLTFQEYFAARYFVRKYFHPGIQGEEWKEFLNDMKFNPKFGVVLWFIAGLLGERVHDCSDSRNVAREAKGALDAFIKCLISQPRSLLGSHELALAMHCSEELEGLSVPSLQQVLEEFVGMLRTIICGKMGKFRINSCATPFQGIRKFYLMDMGQNALQTIKQSDFDCASSVATAFKLVAPGVVDFLIKKIEDQQENSSVSLTAAFTLFDLQLEGETLGKVAEVLIQRMGVDAVFRWQLVEVLGKLQPEGETLRKFAEVLIQSLGIDDSLFRWKVVETLGELKLEVETLEKVADTLIQRLADDDTVVRTAAVRSLGKLQLEDETMGKVADALVQSTWDDEELWQIAAESLRKLQPGAGTLGIVSGTLMQRLEDDDRSVRARAAGSLGQLQLEGEALAKVMETLIQRLEDDDRSVRARAAESLGQLQLEGEALAKVADALIQRLGVEDCDVFRAVFESLGQLQLEGEALAKVMETLIQRLEDDDRSVRARAAESLGQLQLEGAAVAKVVDALIQRLEDDEIRVRARAAVSFGKFQLKGAALAKAVEALIQSLGDEDCDVRFGAVKSLGKLQLEGAALAKVVEALIQSLWDEDCDVRFGAVKSLGKLQLEGAALAKVVEALIHSLWDEDCWVRFGAVKSLGKLQLEGETLTKVVEALIERLGDEDRNVRLAAVESLGKLQLEGKTLEKLAEALIQRLGVEDYHVFRDAAKSLGQLQLKGETLAKVADILIQRLGDEERFQRLGVEEYFLFGAAVESLGKLQLEGAALAKVADALIQRLGDEDGYFRNEATVALGQLQLEGEALAKVAEALIQRMGDYRSKIPIEASKSFQTLIDIKKTYEQIRSNKEIAIKLIAYKIFLSETLCHYQEGCFYYYDQGRLSEPLKMDENDYRKLERFLQTELLVVNEHDNPIKWYDED